MALRAVEHAAGPIPEAGGTGDCKEISGKSRGTLNRRGAWHSFRISGKWGQRAHTHGGLRQSTMPRTDNIKHMRQACNSQQGRALGTRSPVRQPPTSDLSARRACAMSDVRPTKERTNSRSGHGFTSRARRPARCQPCTTTPACGLTQVGGRSLGGRPPAQGEAARCGQSYQVGEATVNLTARRARHGPPHAAGTTPGSVPMDPPPLRL